MISKYIKKLLSEQKLDMEASIKHKNEIEAIHLKNRQLVQENFIATQKRMQEKRKLIENTKL